MKKIVSFLVVSGLFVNCSCFGMDAAWNSAKSRVQSLASKVKANKTVRKLNHKALKIGNEIRNNHEIQLALGTAVATAGGILAYRYLGLKPTPAANATSAKFLTKIWNTAKNHSIATGLTTVGGLASAAIVASHFRKGEFLEEVDKIDSSNQGNYDIGSTDDDSSDSEGESSGSKTKNSNKIVGIVTIGEVRIRLMNRGPQDEEENQILHELENLLEDLKNNRQIKEDKYNSLNQRRHSIFRKLKKKREIPKVFNLPCKEIQEQTNELKTKVLRSKNIMKVGNQIELAVANSDFQKKPKDYFEELNKFHYNDMKNYLKTTYDIIEVSCIVYETKYRQHELEVKTNKGSYSIEQLKKDLMSINNLISSNLEGAINSGLRNFASSSDRQMVSDRWNSWKKEVTFKHNELKTKINSIKSQEKGNFENKVPANFNNNCLTEETEEEQEPGQSGGAFSQKNLLTHE